LFFEVAIAEDRFLEAAIAEPLSAEARFLRRVL